MDRTELTLAIAAALVAAVLFGWILRWIFGRLNSPSGADGVQRTAELATRLHEAEAEAERARSRLAAVEADLGQRLAEVQRELAEAQQELERERANTQEIRDAYRAAMSGFGREGR